MVNYTIVSSILENRFGQIPRPESWLAAEQAMQQSDLSSEQTAADGEDDSQDIPDDCAETEAGHPKPEPNVVDVRHLEPYLLGVEVGTGDSKWLDEGANTLEAPKLSSEALETQEALPFTTSECTETRTGHQKPEDEVVDMQHVVDVLPMFEVGSTGQAWYGKHAKELQAPKSSSEVVEPEVADVQQVKDHLLEVEAGAVDLIQPDEHANILEAPGLSSKALKPESDTTRQASGHSMEDALWTSDPPGTPTKPPTPQVEHSRLQHRPSARVCSAMSTETDLSYTRRSGKQRETKSLELHCKQASRRPPETYRGHSTCETLPDEARGMGVLSSPRVGCGDGMAVEATATRHIQKCT